MRVPQFRKAKELHASKAELTNSGGSIDEIRALLGSTTAKYILSRICQHFPPYFS